MGLIAKRQSRRVWGSFEGIWPDFLRVDPKELTVGDRVMRSFVVIDYPRHVQRGWFEPLLRFPHPMTLAIYQAPLPPQMVMSSMRRHLLWSRGIDGANKATGRLGDPQMETAMEDAERIRQKIARGDSRVLDTSLHMTLWAATLDELNEASELLKNLAESMLIGIRPLHFQHVDGLKWSLPLGQYPPAVREMESDTWATLFPLVSEEIVHPRGSLWGINPQNRSLVLVDRFAMPSPHSITIAWSGAGKSYAAKLEAIRSRYRQLAVYIVDPEGEYRVLEKAGAYIWTVGDPAAPHFPFDPLRVAVEQEHAQWERDTDFLIRFLARLLPDFAGQIKRVVPPLLWQFGQRSVLEQRWQASSPEMDLSMLIKDIQDRDKDLGEQMQMAVVRWRSLIGTVPAKPANPDFQVFDLSRLTPLVKSAAYLAITEWLARQTTRKRQRLVIFDEAWHLLNDDETASYLEELFRRARKWGTALSLITQDINDLVHSRSAEVCLRNAPIILLLKQHPESLHQIGEQLRLHEGEMARISHAAQGEGLLMVGDDHVPIRIAASPAEDAIISGRYQTQNPEA